MTPPNPPHRPWWKPRLITRRALWRIGILFASLALIIGAAAWYFLGMPGSSFSGHLPALTADQAALRGRLQSHVGILASEQGGRSTFNPRGMAAAGKYIIRELESAGYGTPREIFVEAGSRVPNFEVTVPGASRAAEIVVIGAHYDTFQGTPGADDNASGVAAVLELARALRESKLARTIRFVFFVNEEPPAFQTPDMGSWDYAKECKANGDAIYAMLSIESIGYYSDQPGSQTYPLPGLSALYPDTGDFVAFVGNTTSRWLVRRAIGTFRTRAQFPSRGASLPGAIAGVGWSDHWAFWQEGYPGIMVTGTAAYRNGHYHVASDKPDTLDYDRLARVTDGLIHVTRDLASEP